MNIEQLIEYLTNYEPFIKQVAAWHTIPPKEAEYALYPDNCDETIIAVYKNRGIESSTLISVAPTMQYKKKKTLLL